MTPARSSHPWLALGSGVILAAVILAILYGTGVIFPHPKIKKEAICWVSSKNPDYIRFKPGKDPEGNELIPVYPIAAPPTKEAAKAGKEAPKAEYWHCPMHPEIVRSAPGKCPKCGMDLVPIRGVGAAPAAAPKKERKIKYWVDPMDPRNISDRPGKAPCGMDMVPVYEEVGEETGRPGVIQVSPTTVQSMGVRTAKVEVRPLSRVTLAVGLVNFNERSLSTINTKINGWVERLYVNATGDPVRKGQALLSIYSPELVSAQREYLLAVKNLKTQDKSPFPELKEAAQRLAAASRQRLAYWDITPAQIAELERTGQVRKQLVLMSPANGVVTKRLVTQGMYVQAGMPLLEVADLSTVWVDADIYQYELPWIKVGQPVEMTLQYLPGETFHGTIDYLYPYLKEATRTAKVRLKFPNPGLKLKPEMFAQAKIKSLARHQAVVVPADAVLDTGVKQHVFLALGQGRFEPREVKLGVEGDDGLREVLEGLKGGEDVVVSAQFLLDSESRFREAVQMMMGGAEGAKPTPAAPAPPGAAPEKGAAPAAPAPAPMPPGHKH